MKHLFFIFILLAVCHSVSAQDGIPENYKGYNDYGTFAEKAGDKWGIKQGDSNSAWIVDPVYDTIVLINSFQYGIPKYRQTEMTKGYALFLLFDKMPPAGQTELHTKASGVSFHICKVNGELIKTADYDAYELVFKHSMDDNYNVFSELQVMKLFKNGKCTLLEQGFEWYEAEYRDFRKILDYGLWIATTASGQVLMNGNKEILLEAKKIEPYRDSNTYNKYLEQHEIGYMQLDIPYLYVTDDAGYTQLYSIPKKKFVTPKISSQGGFRQIAAYPAELEEQLVMVEVEYSDKGLKGYYNSRSMAGFDCAFEDYYFLTERLDYATLGQGKARRKLYALPEGKEPQFITEYDTLIPGKAYREFMEYYADGLVYGLNGKYGVVHFMNLTDGKLYDTLYPHEMGSWYTFKENGKFGLTDGQTVIPAVFDDTVRFETNRVTAMHGNLWFTQAFRKNGETFYYDSQAREHVSQGNFATRMFGKNQFGIVEHKQMNDAEFVTLVQPIYSYIDPVLYDYTYIAKNKKGKSGLIDLYGDTLIPFEYDWIMSFVPASQGFLSYTGSLFEVKKGKKTALFDTKHGWLTSLDEHTFDFSDNYGVVVEVVKKSGDKLLYGLNTMDGKVLLEPVFEQKSAIAVVANYFNTMTIGRKAFDTYLVSQDNKRDLSQKQTTYHRFDFVDNGYAYRLNCNTNKMEQYSLLHLNLVSAMSPEEFARLHKYNLRVENGQYVLEYHDPMKDDNAVEVVRLEAVDFVMLDRTLFLVGKKGKTWNKYQVEDDGLHNFESFLYKVAVDSRFLRVTSSAAGLR